jgi:hypothetical protein
MIVGSTSKEADDLAQDLIITRCQIYTNGENGVTVLDFTRGTVLIEHCRVYENYHNGLYFLKSKDTPQSVLPKPDQVAPYQDKGAVKVQYCEIARNRQYGVTLSMIRCFISDTTITDNGDGAVSLDERSKQLLKFESQDSEQVRDLVQGSIGGDWGLLYPEKRGLCGRSSCLLM